MQAEPGAPTLYRVWAIRYCDWRPTHWDETPPAGQAVGPVVDACLNWEEACAVLAGFNQTMLAIVDREQRDSSASDDFDSAPAENRLWAIARPVELERKGDLIAGQPAPSAVISLRDYPALPEKRSFS
jgi:hypothetical protein